MQRLGAEIRRRREHLGISQSELARLCETDRLFLVKLVQRNSGLQKRRIMGSEHTHVID
jgi:transcriptional regulator with XRE-family HTH domain